jgi:hypothetical protein
MTSFQEEVAINKYIHNMFWHSATYFSATKQKKCTRVEFPPANNKANQNIAFVFKNNV